MKKEKKKEEENLAAILMFRLYLYVNVEYIGTLQISFPKILYTHTYIYTLTHMKNNANAIDFWWQIILVQELIIR